MERFEYMQIPLKILSDDIIEHYKLHDMTHNGHVLVKICKGMYGLRQEAGRLAYDKLVTHLATHRYAPIESTPGPFKHSTKPVHFTLVVDNFGVKYTNIDDAKHLIACIEKLYESTVDWEGTVYCGVHLKRYHLQEPNSHTIYPWIHERGLTPFQT